MPATPRHIIDRTNAVPVSERTRRQRTGEVWIRVTDGARFTFDRCEYNRSWHYFWMTDENGAAQRIKSREFYDAFLPAQFA